MKKLIFLNNFQKIGDRIKLRQLWHNLLIILGYINCKIKIIENRIGKLETKYFCLFSDFFKKVKKT